MHESLALNFSDDGGGGGRGRIVGLYGIGNA